MTYYDLGKFGRRITTSSPEAQLWFDRGLPGSTPSTTKNP